MEKQWVPVRQTGGTRSRKLWGEGAEDHRASRIKGEAVSTPTGLAINQWCYQNRESIKEGTDPHCSTQHLCTKDRIPKRIGITTTCNSRGFLFWLFWALTAPTWQSAAHIHVYTEMKIINLFLFFLYFFVYLFVCLAGWLVFLFCFICFSRQVWLSWN